MHRCPSCCRRYVPAVQADHSETQCMNATGDACSAITALTTVLCSAPATAGHQRPPCRSAAGHAAQRTLRWGGLWCADGGWQASGPEHQYWCCMGRERPQQLSYCCGSLAQHISHTDVGSTACLTVCTVLPVWPENRALHVLYNHDRCAARHGTLRSAAGTTGWRGGCLTTPSLSPATRAASRQVAAC